MTVGRNSSSAVLAESAKLLRERYAEPIQVDRLARGSGLSPAAFYARFKQQYGLTPLQYLTRCRMERAIELLAEPSNLISDIASAVGYDDAYYFSRAFKRYYGIPPARFRQLANRSILALARSCFANLTALGVRCPHLRLLEAVPESAFGPAEGRAPDPDAVRQLAPDLIVSPATVPLEPLRPIAPTVSVDGPDSDWRQQFQATARQLGMEPAAAAWRERFEARLQHARAVLGKRVGGETVLVVRTGPGKFLVIGKRQQLWGDFLYGDLCLSAPAAVEAETAFCISDIRALDDFGADRILCLSGSAAAPGRLATVPWQQLRAARRGAFHLVSARERPSYSAWYADWLVSHAVTALSRPLTPD